MRLLNIKLGLLFILAFTGSVLAKEYKLGEDYFALGNDVSKAQQITEYFSFYCPACFRQEPLMKSIKASMAQADGFSKNHVTKMPGRDEATETLLSQALIAARLLNVEQPIVDAIFQRIHVARQPFDSVNEIEALFVKQGVSADKFEKTFNSFKVKMEAKRMASNTQKLRNKGYNSVPTLVINNNYIPNIKSIKTIDEYTKLVNHLLTLSE